MSKQFSEGLPQGNLALGGHLAAATHHVEELMVVLGRSHVFQHEFHGLDFVHVVHQLTQDARFLKDFWSQQEFFLAGAATVEVDGREHAFFVQAAVQVDFACLLYTSPSPRD